MKKFYSFMLAILCVCSLGLVGCKDKPESPMNRITNVGCPYLVLYFTRTNHTGEVADEIADELDADIFRIVPKVAYSSDYKKAMSRAKEERATDARPEIGQSLPPLTNYSTIFIGFPVWLNDVPNIIKTLAETADFSGKTIVPFFVHRGGGIGSSLVTMRTLFTGLEFKTEFAIDEDDVGTDRGENAVENWLLSIGVWQWR